MPGSGMRKTGILLTMVPDGSGQMEKYFTNLHFPEIFGDFPSLLVSYLLGGFSVV